MLALLGLGVGGFYGLLACGVVVGHKGSGLINLDQGALAMYPAFTFVSVRESGDVYFPWFDFIPGPIDVPYRLSIASEGLSKPVALIAALLMSLLLGVIVQTLVFGPLRHKPAISKIIGSLGALLYLSSVALFQFGGRARNVDGILPDGGWNNPFGLDGRLPHDRITLAAIALVVGGALALWYRGTATGLATRAVEDAEVGVSLLGYSPNRIATINWMISTTITGLAGILALDLVSLTPSRYTLFVVPALGAALVGNLSSPWLAAVGGVALGMFQSSAAGLTLEDWWPNFIPQEGVRQAVPLLVIVLFQFTRGHALPVRSTRLTERQPQAPPIHRAWATVVMVIGIGLWILADSSRVTEGKLVSSTIAAILMLSSVVLIGYLGQLNLAALTFAGVAAYLTTRFAADGTQVGVSPIVLDGPGLPDPLAATLGIGVAVIVGVIIAVPAVRIRGLQLAVVTLAAAVAATELVLGNPSIIGRGAGSNLTVPPPRWFGVDVGVVIDSGGLPSRTRLAIFALLWLAIVMLAVVGLRRGTVGRQFLAVRSNERAAEASGVSVIGSKLLGFGIASAIAGIAGVLTAYQQTVLNIDTWGAIAGIGNVALLFLGGVGRVTGAILGGVLAPGGLTTSTSASGEVLRNAVVGAALIAVAIFRSDGLVSVAAGATKPIRRALARAD